MPLSSPRGTHDLLPAAADRTRHLELIAHHRLLQAGYGEIRTPAFEDTALFSRSIGEETDIVSKEMYTFSDRKGRSLTLRPEGTAAIARAYIQHKLYAQPGPVKLYYLGSMWRYERPQAGRMRQFDQIGGEVLGSAAAGYDAEIITVAATICGGLKFTDLEVRLNSLGCPADRPPYYDALRAHFAQFAGDLCTDCRGRLEKNPMRVLDCKVSGCQPAIADAPTPFQFLCADCAAHHAQVQALLDAAGRSHTHDPHLVRGLDYYTRTVFEIHHAGLGARSALCGGGRYDGLVEQLGGPPTPAVGFSIGVVPLLLAAEQAGLLPEPRRQERVIICPLVAEAHEAAQRFVTALRDHDVAADADWSGRSLKAQLKQAHRRAAHYAVLLGADELASGTAQVRNLEESKQSSVPLDDVVRYLTEHLGTDERAT